MHALFAILVSSPFQIGPAELPWAAVDRPYTQEVRVQGGTRCPDNDLRVWTEGALPDGVELDGNGRFRGVPRRTGSWRFRVRAGNACAETGRDYTLVVTGAPLLLADPEQLQFHYRRQGPPPPQRIRVQSTWPSLEFFVAKAGVPWLRAVARAGRTPRPGAAVDCDLVEVTADPAELAAGEYRATLRLWTWEGANQPSISVHLTVE